MLISFNSNATSNILDKTITFQSQNRLKEFNKDIRQLQRMQRKEEKLLLKTIREITERPQNIFEKIEFFFKKILH